ncbi:sorbosone dehydrogenase family protein [Sphingomonas ginkgonis]|uniref:Sorbosone dehydrogenase family protein n=1 Tax=Sphingomonas ginkgonis TaxID=2315330 RepID=A0A429VBW2_9SPHN|nr:sorbosone dehydrogenase family protein [Sphingomonas ginkgonis]RST31470.1 sorbosone dehydrogenase family protein [Sphingomonas ginkgonis]
MKRLIATTALIALLAACSDPPFDETSQIGPNPSLPKPKQFLFPPMHIAPGEGWKNGAVPTVPAGFQVKALATGLAHPRFVYALPNGDVLAVQGDSPNSEPFARLKQLVFEIVRSGADNQPNGPKPASRITLIRDANGDGTPEGTSVLLDNLNSPFGVAWIDNTLYVANTDSVVAYPMPLGTTKITAPGRKLADLPGGPIDHHWTKSLVLSPDGSKLYATVGSNSNIMENGLEAEKGRAAIWEIDRATGASRQFAGGLRNPNSPQFYPGTNTLYTVVNERDELGSHLVPDYLTSVKPGGFYGWPYSYYGQNVDVRIPPMLRRPDLVAKAIPPDYALGSHVAALGLTFYTGASFPAQYRGGAFIGEHGSWDRYTPSGYKVVFVPFAGGKPSGKAVDFVTGFVDSKADKSHGRPVGVAVDRTGALLVADDVGNTVWRVTPTAPAPRVAMR